MAIYRFRVSFEDYEEVFREIEIKSDQTFEDLHFAIQESIGFDASKPASFYLSNDHWMKGQEISLQERPARNGDSNILMNKSVLKDWIVDPHQKIYYESDYATLWSFYIELVKIFPIPENRVKYPKCIKINGDAPKQYGGTVPFKIEEDEEGELPEIITDDYVEEDKYENDEPEEVIDEDEADAITGEGLGEEGSSEEVI